MFARDNRAKNRVRAGVRITLGCCTAVLFLLSAQTAISTGNTRVTAGEGVFTAEEVKRGEALYAANCAVCHREDMGGKDPAPELAGETFMSKWSGKSVGELLTRTRTTMPFGKPNSLSVREYLDIIAVMLEANEFSSGERQLPESQSDLDAIVLE